MKQIKFRCWIPQLDKYVYSGQQDWSVLFDKEILAIEGYGEMWDVDQDDLKTLLWRNPKTKEEFYEGDQVGFNRQGRPLFIQSALILVDNVGNVYQWDERFFDEPNDVFPQWVKQR